MGESTEPIGFQRVGVGEYGEDVREDAALGRRGRVPREHEACARSEGPTWGPKGAWTGRQGRSSGHAIRAERECDAKG